MGILILAALALGPMLQSPPGNYIGDAACLSCHDTHGYAGTAHADQQNPRTPAATHGCESCHGPGRQHAEGGDPSSIKNPASLPVKEGIATCTACHDPGKHPQAAGGQAVQVDAGCVSCHSVHHAVAAKLLKTRKS
jgi:hypothetical protein